MSVVQDYLVKRREFEQKRKEKDRIATFERFGLLEKEYGPEKSEYYCEEEWDYTNQRYLYYRYIIPKCTDEEYEELLSYTKAPESENNSVATIFTVMAWIIFIIGFIVGIVGGSSYNIFKDETEFNFATACAYWIASFVSGMMFIGIAEIIKLLNDIKNKKN